MVYYMNMHVLGSDSSTLIGEASDGRLCPVLSSAGQERHEQIGKCPEVENKNG